MEYIYDPVAGTIRRNCTPEDETTTEPYVVRVKNRERCDCDPEKPELRHRFRSAAEALDYINKLNENRMQTLRHQEEYRCKVCHAEPQEEDDDDVDYTAPPHIQVIGEIRFQKKGGTAVKECWKVIDAGAERTLTFHRGDRVLQYVRDQKKSQQQQ